MAAATGSALLLLIAFVLPGFVAVLVAERVDVVPVERSPFQLLLMALYYSVLSYVLLGLASVHWGSPTPVHLRHLLRHTGAGRLAVAALIGIVVVPAAIALLGVVWRRSGLRGWLWSIVGLHEGHQVETAWDCLFRSRKAFLVRAVLSDGRVIAGYYGSGSFAPYSAQAQDLFLETRWDLDDDKWFLRATEKSLGVLVSASAIVSMELYDPGNGTQGTTTNPAGDGNEARGT
ncbi:MAG: hypothetical protein QOF08_2994 [Gaiellales bacterium]|nr:hypothetical protein [Gaiellales bacterium]